MSDDVEPPPDGKVKTKKKRKLKRANTTPAKQKAPSDGITLARLEHNAFSSQLHMLDDDKVDPSQTEYDTAVQRKLARLRLKNRGQRQSAPTSPKTTKSRTEKKTFASSARTSFTQQPIPPTQPIHPPDDMFDTSGFDDPFFNTAAPSVQQPRPPPPALPRKQNSVPIAEEIHTTQFVALAPAAKMTVTPSTTTTTTTTREVRSHTLPTLPMSATTLANDPLAPIEKDQSTKFATTDDHLAFSADTKPKLKDQDSTDLSDFFQMSMSAPTSRRQSRETPFQPYFHPAGADAAGRRPVVHVPVYVPVYNVAGGVPYQQPAHPQPVSIPQQPHMYSAPQAVQQPIQQPAPSYGYPQPTGNPYANYPMTPPARMPSHRGW